MRSTAKAGLKPPREIIREAKRVARAAKKFPEEYDPDCPPSGPEALREFAELRAARIRDKKRPTVTLRITPEILEQYKSLGKGYTGIMADVLTYAAKNPEILSKV
jgi:uncharacterized protein (DUF4415 family)